MGKAVYSVRSKEYRIIGLLLLLAALAVGCLAGCQRKIKTEPNTVSTFFYDGSRFEATVRELTIAGNQVEARVRIINVGGYSVNEVHAEALFLDNSGNVLYTDAIDLPDEPLLAGDSVSVTVSCTGKNAKKVERVNVSGQD